MVESEGDLAELALHVFLVRLGLAVLFSWTRIWGKGARIWGKGVRIWGKGVRIWGKSVWIWERGLRIWGEGVGLRFRVTVSGEGSLPEIACACGSENLGEK